MSTVQSLFVDNALRWMPLEPEEVPQKLKEQDAIVWLDLQLSESSEIEPWLDKLEVKGLARRLCLEARSRAGFYPLKNELVMVTPVLRELEDSGVSSGVDYVAVLLTGKLLLTIRRKPIKNEQRMFVLQEEQDWLPERSVAGLLSAVLMKMSLDILRQASALRDAIVALEERMDRDPDSVEVEEIVDLRSDLFPLGVAVSEQLPIVEQLSTTQRPFFNLENVGDYMNCALVNLKAANVALDWLDQRLAALRSGFQMHAQENTNRRLGILTILSAIFMPITLMAGIWGMNFEHMPELKYTFAYPMALGLMLSIAVGMFLFFRKTGWFD